MNDEQALEMFGGVIEKKWTPDETARRLEELESAAIAAVQAYNQLAASEYTRRCMQSLSDVLYSE